MARAMPPKNSVLPDFVPFAWQRAAMMDLNDNTGSPQTIWIISQYASTPETSMGGRHYYLARELDALGYQVRSEQHTPELQSLMRISSAVFCLHKTIQHTYTTPYYST